MTNRIPSGGQPLNAAQRAQIVKYCGLQNIQLNGNESDEALLQLAQDHGFELTFEHNEDAVPLTPEQQEQKAKARAADQAEIDAAKAAALKRDNEQYRTEIDPEFKKKAEAYADAQTKYQTLLQQEEATRKQFNAVKEKNFKKTMTGPDGKPMPKDAARKAWEKALEDVQKQLKEAREDVNAKRTDLGDNLARANRYNREQANAAARATEDPNSEANKKASQLANEAQAAETKASNLKDAYLKAAQEYNSDRTDAKKAIAQKAYEEYDQANKEAQQKRTDADNANAAAAVGVKAARQRAQIAARTEMDDYYNSADGKAAAMESTRQLARGNADHRLSHAERKDEKRLKDVKDTIGDVSNRYAGLTQKRAEKNYQELLKRDALKEIVIGDKDAYKAKRKDDENGYPTVTYMSEKTYNAAREYAASKGLVLPKFEDIKGKSLTGNDMRQFQQLMEDAAGDFGSRADINERKDISDNFRGISFTRARLMIDAANVTVQKSYKTAATVAGLVTTGLLGGIGGVTKELADKTIEEVVQRVIPGAGPMVWVPGSGGALDTGHYEFTDLKYDDIVTRTEDGGSRFNWSKEAKAAGAGALVTAAILLVGQHDTNLLQKGKTLEDLVYDSLFDPKSGVDKNFKKWRPNAKAVMTKFIADTSLTPEQKLAILQKAGGIEGFKENPRELVSAVAAAKGFKPGDKPPVSEIIPGLDERTVYDVGGGQFVDKDGNDITDEMKDATYIRDDKVTDDAAKAVGSRGTAYDQQVVDKDKGNTFTREQTEAVDENGDLTDYNRQQARSQYTSADRQGDVRIEGGTPLQPAKIELDSYENYIDKDGNKIPDDKGGFKHNTYKYHLISDADARAAGAKGDGPFYMLDEVIGPDGDITQSQGKIFKLSVDEAKQLNDRGSTYQSTTDEEGFVTSRTKSNIKQVNYHMDAATMEGKSSPRYPDANPHFKKN